MRGDQLRDSIEHFEFSLVLKRCQHLVLLWLDETSEEADRGLFEIPGKDDGEILGEDGLRDVLTNLGGLPPALVAGDILQDLANFQGHSKFEDDVSLIVARFDPSAAMSQSSTSLPISGSATLQTTSLKSILGAR